MNHHNFISTALSTLAVLTAASACISDEGFDVDELSEELSDGEDLDRPLEPVGAAEPGTIAPNPGTAPSTQSANLASISLGSLGATEVTIVSRGSGVTVLEGQVNYNSLVALAIDESIGFPSETILAQDANATSAYVLGTSAAESIYLYCTTSCEVQSKQGDDHIEMLLRNDMDGQLTVHAGNGADTILGGSGDDVLEGAGGDDYVHGKRGSDRIAGGLGEDDLYGGLGADLLFGDRFDATQDLYADFFSPGQGNDVVWTLDQSLDSGDGTGELIFNDLQPRSLPAIFCARYADDNISIESFTTGAQASAAATPNEDDLYGVYLQQGDSLGTSERFRVVCSQNDARVDLMWHRSGYGYGWVVDGYFTTLNPSSPSMEQATQEIGGAIYVGPNEDYDIGDEDPNFGYHAMAESVFLYDSVNEALGVSGVPNQPVFDPATGLWAFESPLSGGERFWRPDDSGDYLTIETGVERADVTDRHLFFVTRESAW